MPVEKGAQLIAEDIIKEAEKKAAEVIREAKREASAILETARQGIKEEEERGLRQALARSERVYEEIMAEGRMRAKKETLQKKEGFISGVFKGAEEKLRTHVASKDYEEDLIRIAIDACRKLGSSDVVIRANRRDLKILQRFKEQIVSELSSGGGVINTSFGEPVQTIGGVVVGVPDGKVEIDETFEGRMRREFEALRVKVARALFEGSG